MILAYFFSGGAGGRRAADQERLSLCLFHENMTNGRNELQTKRNALVKGNEHESETEAMGGGSRTDVPAGSRPLVRRHRRGIRPPGEAHGGLRHGEVAGRAKAAAQSLFPERPERRGARRKPHLHKHAREGRRRPHQQLDRAGRAQAHPRRPVRRLHEGPDLMRTG